MWYYLYEEQDGGCDYTIGCGRRLRRIKDAASMEDAVRLALEVRINGWGEDESMIRTPDPCIGGSEFCPDRAMILEVAEEFEVDLAALAEARNAVRRDAEKNAAEEKERAEYERLKAKFGK